MIKIEALTLEQAYSDASAELQCSVTELEIEVVQYPTKGILGLFRKKAVIVAHRTSVEAGAANTETVPLEPSPQESVAPDEMTEELEDDQTSVQIDSNDGMIEEIKTELNRLFNEICFEIDTIEVRLYDENTILVEFTGEDAALLIGKEGYRYKALSYMIFNWINTKYQMGLRLEIAEFLKNQEEAIRKYLEGVCEGIDRDGRAQTKILDGVLVQIALRELRDRYPDKYVAIRTTRDGLKYIIVNDYHSH
jgi:spoIIIJ-associated protein